MVLRRRRQNPASNNKQYIQNDRKLQRRSPERIPHPLPYFGCCAPRKTKKLPTFSFEVLRSSTSTSEASTRRASASETYTPQGSACFPGAPCPLLRRAINCCVFCRTSHLHMSQKHKHEIECRKIVCVVSATVTKNRRTSLASPRRLGTPTHADAAAPNETRPPPFPPPIPSPLLPPISFSPLPLHPFLPGVPRILLSSSDSEHRGGVAVFRDGHG